MDLEISAENCKTLKGLSAGLKEVLLLINTRLTAMDTNINKLTKDDVVVKSLEKVQQTADAALTQMNINTVEIAKIRKDVDKMQFNYDNVNKENIKLKSQINSIEDYGRRNNLVIRGVAESKGENCENVVRNFMKTQLHCTDEFILDVKFVRCHRVGRKEPNSTWNRPLIVRFFYFGHREIVWGKRHLLAKSKYSLNENFCASTEFNRKKLYPVYSALKKLPDYQKKITMVKDDLIIDGDRYNVDNLQDLPAHIHPKNYTRKTNENTLVFGGVLSEFDCFSNWSPSPINYDDTDYVCVEQAYMHAKAKAHGDANAAKLIMYTEDPRDIKKIGLSITLDKSIWTNDKRKQTMLDIVRAKFMQNDAMKTELLNTNGKKLGESGSNDNFFAIGLAFTNKDVLDAESWKGQSVLGTILETIRNEL